MQTIGGENMFILKITMKYENYRVWYILLGVRVGGGGGVMFSLYMCLDMMVENTK